MVGDFKWIFVKPKIFFLTSTLIHRHYAVGKMPDCEADLFKLCAALGPPSRFDKMGA